MRHGGDEFPLIGQLLLDPSGHVVDGLGERADLAGLMPAEAHAALQFAFADLACDERELSERTPEAVRDEE